MIRRKLSALIRTFIQVILLRLEEMNAMMETSNDRKRRYIIKTSTYRYVTMTIDNIHRMNKRLHKNWSIIDVLNMSESIIEIDSSSKKVVRFGKDDRTKKDLL